MTIAFVAFQFSSSPLEPPNRLQLRGSHSEHQRSRGICELFQKSVLALILFRPESQDSCGVICSRISSPSVTLRNVKIPFGYLEPAL